MKYLLTDHKDFSVNIVLEADMTAEQLQKIIDDFNASGNSIYELEDFLDKHNVKVIYLEEDLIHLD